jgi:hypothetical protein
MRDFSAERRTLQRAHVDLCRAPIRLVHFRVVLSGRLLTPAEAVTRSLSRAAAEFRAVVAKARGSFQPAACEFTDVFFCELLARGSSDPKADAKRLATELATDPVLAQAVHDEYVTAYRTALAAAHQNTLMPQPSGVWVPAVAGQTKYIELFVATLRREAIPRLASTVPPRLVTASTAREVQRIREVIVAGVHLDLDHDVAWGHIERGDGEARVARKLGRKQGNRRQSVEWMVRRHRGRHSLGIHTQGVRRGGKTWLRRLRRESLWYARLRPLHPPRLQSETLDRIRSLLTWAAARTKQPKEDTRVPRKGNVDRVPKRVQEVVHLLPPALWKALRHVLPPDSPREVPSLQVLLGALVVLHHDINWADLPQELELGSGRMVKRRLDKWSTDGVWAKVAPVLEAHRKASALPALKLGRVGPYRSLSA